jgi:hypothetical protein
MAAQKLQTYFSGELRHGLALKLDSQHDCTKVQPSSFKRSRVPSLVPAHDGTGIEDLWPGHIYNSVGSRFFQGEHL